MPDTCRYSDEDLLRIVGDERRRSIGFGEGDGGELTSARERALDYARGEMTDVPSLPNRSSVVDTSVAEAVETVLPDVMEVFVGGEDVATFVPQGEADEAAAQEESDYVGHVVFAENEGFLTLYTAIKDALLTRTGIIHWWWEEETKTETCAVVSADMAELAQAAAPVVLGAEVEAEAQGDGRVALLALRRRGRVRIRAFPSEDFTVAPDTVSLREATYCAVRDRPRVQDLIARGIDAELARTLRSYAAIDGAVSLARDRAGEGDTIADGATGDLRTVEVRDHYVRLADEAGRLEVWRVTTDGEETTLLDKEKVDQIPFAALTPYITPHRFYGESVADKLIQVQQIKTVLLRNHMDSIYFALNQRMEVDMSRAGEFTISDLLRNEPGVPIRVKAAGAINAVAAGALNVDTLSSLEYAATMAEARSGIVRNAQGLNPDTLHDTARGALALIGAAQKRVRMIARVFAETGVKDLFLGVHALLRRGYGAAGEGCAPAPAKLKNRWREVRPAAWRERCAMAVHVGVGSAGREHDLMVAGQRLQLMEKLVELPGAMGTLIDAANVHNGLVAWERAAGGKAPELYWSNPEGKAAPPAAPEPNVALAKLQGELALKRYQVDAELKLKRDQLVAELALKRELALAGMASADVHVGGQPG